MGNSESTGATSPISDLKGAPNRRRAVGDASSVISYWTCLLISSRLRSIKQKLQSASLLTTMHDRQTAIRRQSMERNRVVQCSCFPVKICPGISDEWRTLPFIIVVDSFCVRSRCVGAILPGYVRSTLKGWRWSKTQLFQTRRMGNNVHALTPRGMD